MYLYVEHLCKWTVVINDSISNLPDAIRTPVVGVGNRLNIQITAYIDDLSESQKALN